MIAERYEAATAIVREAGDLALAAFRARRRGDPVTLKGPQDFVTETDTAVEHLLRARLGERFPSDDFFGEEGGGRHGDSLWIADPIDGTANFVRGLPGFCVSLAWLLGGRIEIGLIYDPLHGELFSATRGGGATVNGEPLRVSGTAATRDAMVEAGWSNRLPMERYVALLGRVAATGAGLRRGGSGALGMAYVAAGRLDAYCEMHINAWDVAAGLLLVTEAGGWTNDFLAGDGLRSGNPVLACTPDLRGALMEATGIA